MRSSSCGCGFEVPPVSTVQIKTNGALETNYPLKIDSETQRVINMAKSSGRKISEACYEHCMNIIKNMKVKNEMERLQRIGGFRC
jgi:hypothetical protein